MISYFIKSKYILDIESKNIFEIRPKIVNSKKYYFESTLKVNIYRMHEPITYYVLVPDISPYYLKTLEI